MKKVIFCLIITMVLITVTGCKKNADVSNPVRISYFDIRPQVINEDETAWITVAVSDMVNEVVLVKSLVDNGLTNPPVTSTTGNPVYIEYIPPRMDAGETLRVNITIILTDLNGKELDRVEGRVTVED